MSTKITFYTHYKYSPDYDSLDLAYDERLAGEYNIEYFKYIPLKAINDTFDDIVNYVTVQYGSWYKEIIQKMKDGVKLSPIKLYKEPDKKGIFTLDLYKEHKIMFLASKHMGYNYIPAIVQYSQNAPITYLPIKSKERIKPGTWIKLSEPYTRRHHGTVFPKNKPVMVIDRFSNSKTYRRAKKYPRESSKLITHYNYDIAYLNYKKGRKRTLDIQYSGAFDDSFTLECSQPSKKYQKMFIKQLCARPARGCEDAIKKIAREKGIEYIDKNKSGIV